MTPSEAVHELVTRGLTEVEIAVAVSTTQPTINRIRNGKVTPSYTVGKALVDLAEQQSDQAA